MISIFRKQIVLCDFFFLTIINYNICISYFELVL